LETQNIYFIVYTTEPTLFNPIDHFICLLFLVLQNYSKISNPWKHKIFISSFIQQNLPFSNRLIISFVSFSWGANYSKISNPWKHKIFISSFIQQNLPNGHTSGFALARTLPFSNWLNISFVSFSRFYKLFIFYHSFESQNIHFIASTTEHTIHKQVDEFICLLFLVLTFYSKINNPWNHKISRPSSIQQNLSLSNRLTLFIWFFFSLCRINQKLSLFRFIKYLFHRFYHRTYRMATSPRASPSQRTFPPSNTLATKTRMRQYNHSQTD